MTYIPPRFRVTRSDLIEKLMDQFPFATLISVDAQSDVQLTHLPLLRREASQGWVLEGHLANANPHSKILKDEDCKIIFNGPHGYVSPTWYEADDVPTWNYCVLHIVGRVRIKKERTEIEAILRRLSSRMTELNYPNWQFWLPDDLAGNFEHMITGFEVEIKDIQAKFKLSQNRSVADQMRVVQALEKSGRESDRLLAAWMKEINQV